MLLATRTVFIEFQPIGIVAAILFGGVISLLAFAALQRDDRANVLFLGSHVTTLLSKSLASHPG
jgi:prepilin-type processing-associated H-X9-DG protein